MREVTGWISTPSALAARGTIAPAHMVNRSEIATDLDAYFDFLATDDIRIRGTRIGIESILYEYIHRSQSPEAIAERFHTVSLEQVYATILYYLRNRERLDAYLADWLAFSRTAREAQERNPPPVVVRLRQRKTQQRAIS